MLYREIESIGEAFNEKEYEGTPQEIAELIRLNKKEVYKSNLTVQVPDFSDSINKIAKRVSEQMQKAELTKSAF